MSSTDDENENHFTPEQLRGWEEYRNTLLAQKVKSDDSFEKAITFITAGALGLTITFHDKIVPVQDARWTIIIGIGWLLMVATLFINLYSHYKSSKSTDYSLEEINKVLTYEMDYDEFDTNLNSRNKKIDLLNLSTIWLLGCGLLLLIFYVSINIYHGKEKRTTEQTDSTKTAEGRLSEKRTDNSTSIIFIKQ